MSETIGQKLIALRERAGVSLKEIADMGDYRGASSVQAYFNQDYTRPLSTSTAFRLSRALVGRGQPPISADDVRELTEPDMLRLGDHPLAEGEMRHEFHSAPSTPTLRGQPKDVPVYGSALAADLAFDTEGNGAREIEITNFEMGEVIAHVRRPPGLSDQRKVYAIFVSGSSMEPRYRPGDPVFVDPQRPPAIGDDVIVQLVSPDGTGEIMTGLIKTMVKRSSHALELEQYSPAIRFSVPTERIAHIHRVIPWREAFGM